ncbi:RNaseH domain-containing protein [Streptomyces sp. NBC_01589]|uniref:RNaseH domain-containing protein n=1 Tax=unclassified Streptomyces TaxID=2593676 RepID=UPI0038685801
MPGLAEFVVLGCHTDDGYDPEALAMVAHLLRQPPDYPQALARPLPLHLAASPRNTPCPPVSRRRRRRRTNQVPLGTRWTTRTPHCRRPPDSTRQCSSTNRRSSKRRVPLAVRVLAGGHEDVAGGVESHRGRPCLPCACHRLGTTPGDQRQVHVFSCPLVPEDGERRV